MVAKRSDYTVEAVEAARSVLLELSRLSGEYQDSVVVVGGWVPAGNFHSDGMHPVQQPLLPQQV
jgi:hypothetical protein